LRLGMTSGGEKHFKMKRLMMAEILFSDPLNVKPATAELNALGFKVEVLDLIDPYGPTVWIEVMQESGLDEDQFFDWVARFMEPLGGDVLEAGLYSAEAATFRREVRREESRRLRPGKRRYYYH
jgi:hypothetical protein